MKISKLSCFFVFLFFVQNLFATNESYLLYYPYALKPDAFFENNVSASLSTLIGKEIIIVPFSETPSSYFYKMEVLKKNKFVDKYRYEGENLFGKVVKVLDVNFLETKTGLSYVLVLEHKGNNVVFINNIGFVYYDAADLYRLKNKFIEGVEYRPIREIESPILSTNNIKDPLIFDKFEFCSNSNLGLGQKYSIYRLLTAKFYLSSDRSKDIRFELAPKCITEKFKVPESVFERLNTPFDVMVYYTNDILSFSNNFMLESDFQLQKKLEEDKKNELREKYDTLLGINELKEKYLGKKCRFSLQYESLSYEENKNLLDNYIIYKAKDENLEKEKFVSSYSIERNFNMSECCDIRFQDLNNGLAYYAIFKNKWSLVDRCDIYVVQITNEFEKYISTVEEYEKAVELKRKKQQEEYKKQQEEYRKQQEIEKKERLASLIKKYGEKNADLIIRKEVRIGFTKQMCIESWGEPYDINRTITAGGTREQWVYYGSRYLYFDDGILTTIQD